MPQAEYNAVYLPAGDLNGWLRFESLDGKHLYRLVDLEMWSIRDTFDPAAVDVKGYVGAADGLLPVGEQQWTCFDNGWKDLPLTLTLLATEAEVETDTDRLRCD